MAKPKNPRIKALENKVERLEKEIERLLVEKGFKIDEESLQHIAVGGVRRSETGLYYLQIIRYNPNTGYAKVAGEIEAGDAMHRAIFEFNKFSSTNVKFEEI